jgi:hypothetical protein
MDTKYCDKCDADYDWAALVCPSCQARDAYLELLDKYNLAKKEIEDLRDLLHDCVDHLEGQFDSEDNIAMMKKIRAFLDKKFEVKQ